MIKVSKLGVALVFSLLLGLAVSATDASAQGLNRNVERGNINTSAHAVVLKNVTQGIAGNVLHPLDWCGGAAWGGACGGCVWGGCNFGLGGREFRCSVQTVCHFVQQCFFSHWGRMCHSIRVCRRISICHRFGGWGWDGDGWGGGGGGWGGSWAVKRSALR